MSTWHINSDQPNGQLIYTRQPEPAGWGQNGLGTYDYLAFDDATLRRFIAVHEAGHAVLHFAFGMPVAEMQVTNHLGKEPGDGPAAWVKPGTGKWTVSYMAYLAMLAAGERAQDRWMREQGLWTPERAWAAERGAGSDRQQAAEALKEHCDRELHYGTSSGPTGVQYHRVQAVADSALSHLWDRLLPLAAALDEHGHLTGRQAAVFADMSTVAVPCEEWVAAA